MVAKITYQTIHDLEHSIAEEREAARRYRIRAASAKVRGDTATHALYLHIAREEDTHAREFTERLNKARRMLQ